MTLLNKDQCNLYMCLTTAMVLTSKSFDGSAVQLSLGKPQMQTNV